MEPEATWNYNSSNIISDHNLEKLQIVCYFSRMTKLPRLENIRNIKELQDTSPVVALLGPRQCGKTTLARQLEADHYFDLENPRDVRQLSTPQLTLERLKGLIVIDEVQRAPELFPLLRYLVDNHQDQKYLLLGSASPEILTKTSESLAGRVAFYELGGFNLGEVDFDINKLWSRGGFPRSFLAKDDSASVSWRENFIATYLERDIPQLGIRVPSGTLRKFWTMLAHYQGCVLNQSELGRSFGVAANTIKHYLEILEGTFVLQLLQPWFSNSKKRLVKSPKVYIRDSGLFHTLLSIQSFDDLLKHPKLGSSWEAFVINSIFNLSTKPRRSFYFWATHSGAELDLFWRHKGKNYGVEVKYQDAPGKTKSMRQAIVELQLEKLWVIYPGDKRYLISENIIALPLLEIGELKQHTS